MEDSVICFAQPAVCASKLLNRAQDSLSKKTALLVRRAVRRIARRRSSETATRENPAAVLPCSEELLVIDRCQLFKIVELVVVVRTCLLDSSDR